MHIIPEQLYHIYSQGNNQEAIFRERADYVYFLNRVRKRVLPVSDIICYCLMPNHYHFMVNANPKACMPVKLGNIISQELPNAFRILNSGYANEFNKKYKRSGSLFRQKTKFKLLTNNSQSGDYSFICFNYIHQNPLKSGLVKKMEDWEFSSFQDYLGNRNGTLCNYTIARELLGINNNTFYEESYAVIQDSVLDKLI